MAALDLTTWMSYAFFIICLVFGWSAAGTLDFDRILRRSTSRWLSLLLRVGVALVFAEGFRLFLSYVLGQLLDMFVFQSIKGFKAY